MSQLGSPVPAAPDAAELIRRAAMLMSVSRQAEAIALLTDALRLTPDDARALGEMSRAFLAVDAARALEFADRTVAAAPEWEYGHRLRSIALSSLRHHPQALAAARTAVGLDPHSPTNQAQLFDCLRALGRRAEARQTAKVLVEMAPELESAHLAAGLSALDAGVYRDAEAAFRRAAAINPLSWKAVNNLAVALEKQGRRREAVEMFYRAAQLDPSKPLPRSNVAQAGRRYFNAGGATVAAGIAVVMMASIAVDTFHLSDDAAAVIICIAIIASIVGGYLIRRERAKHFKGDVGRYIAQLRRDSLGMQQHRLAKILLFLTVPFWLALAPGVTLSPSIGTAVTSLVVTAVLALHIRWVVRSKR